MVDDYKQTGQFPKWSQNSGETYVMVGDPADALLADYYAFGARNFDTATALSGMIKEATTANNNRPGLNYYQSIGYLPSNGTYPNSSKYFYYGGPASTTLEYNADDFAISSLAGALGDTADQAAFATRAQSWQNLFNHSSGFIQPRDYSGAWTASFSPTSGSNFTEGDSWQYTPMVPFNVQGLANAMGGNAKLATFLNNDLASYTGVNGLANMGNEESLVMPWEYDYIGQPYKTQQVERAIQDQLWTNAANGMPGNDDLGEMSSSYVWSALGMYPVTAGTGDLALGSPMFTQAVITLPSGNTLTVNGNGAADNAPYIQSAAWNGSAWNNAYVPAGATSAGGTLDFTLGTSANTSWATGPSSAPPSYAGNPTYTDIGVSADSVANPASFDGKGNSFSATALSNAGVNPGSTVTVNGVPFTWPSAASCGQQDNYLANGQTLPVSGSGAVSFLGSADYGPSSGTAIVNYTDGMTQSVPITFSDWTLNGGTGSLAAGETIAATTAYRNTSSGSRSTGKAYVFATAPVSLTPGKTVASVSLPSDVTTGGMHIFAVGFTGPNADPVSVTSPGNQSTTVGTAVSLPIAATDSSTGQTLTYSATALPAGLSINPSSGVISGTATTAGTSQVTVTVTDTAGASGSTSFTWKVS